MPPKVTDNRPASAESLHAVPVETALAAQRIVATYAEDFLDGVTLMSMLGVEPEGLIHRKVVEELEANEAATKKASRKTTKKAAKKATKKAAKKATKKAAKKSTKKAAKKATKKATKKAQ
ncbi:hypothetical protein [Corynebacterium sp.]|uniref:hypothetical protein n=1 Tax=Corynebacterium sp. TaxID=1720 RepID=UPI0026288FEB|nr:hypothetical protein [Corynebacterium sp.]